MTSLCPDRCNHVTDVTVFKVVNYVSYEKPGKEGDEKQDTIRCDIKKSIYGQEPAVVDAAKAATVGKKYYVDYDHIYITDDSQSKYPARPVKKIVPAE
jgi:hypothetical protein